MSDPRPKLDQSPAPPIDQSLPDPLPPDPLPTLAQWLEDARLLSRQTNFNAMALATVDPDGGPSVRIVLCKEIDPAAGYLVFYTNYRARKARGLDAHPAAAACFHWDQLERQARVEGPVTRSPEAESDAYFHSRPWMSRIGAWASDQSEPIGSRAELVAKLESTMRRFGIDPANPPAPEDTTVQIPRPQHWGGYRLWAARVELWVGGIARLHDRALWTRSLGPASTAVATAGQFQPGYFPETGWTAQRLQP